jgi:hypothetical protein
LLVSVFVGHVMTDDTPRSGSEDAVVRKMAGHTTHQGALYAALRIRRRGSQADTYQANRGRHRK